MRRRGGRGAARSLRGLQGAGRAGAPSFAAAASSLSPTTFTSPAGSPAAAGRAAPQLSAGPQSLRQRPPHHGGSRAGRAAPRSVPRGPGRVLPCRCPQPPRGKARTVELRGPSRAPPRVRKERHPTTDAPRAGMLSPRRRLACGCRVGIAPVLSITSSLRGYKYLLGILIAASS